MNARQVALVAWACIALVWCLFQGTIRRSIFDLVKTVLSVKLLVPALLSLSWIAAVVYGLYRVGAWSPALWWDTAVFAVAGTTSLVWRMMDSANYSVGFYRDVLARAVAVSVLVGAFASTYVFGLPVELVLVPLLFVLGGVQAVAASSDEYAAIRKPIGFVIVAVGAAMLIRAVAGAIADYRGFLSLLTVQSLLLIFVLTLAYIPFLLCLRVWSTYELAFVPLSLGDRKPFLVRAYARLRIVLRHGLNLGKLHRFRTGAGNELRFVMSRADVDAVFDQDD